MTATRTEPRGMQLFDESTSLLDRTDDPLGFQAGDANLYWYVGNQPTKFIDPTGLEGQVAKPNPGDQERQEIIRKAREWYNWYKQPGNGKGWPNDTCEDQALSLRDDIKGPWKNWEVRGVSGWRWVWPRRPPGYKVPRVQEAENGVGIFPKGNNKSCPFVIDGFHDYRNDKEDITVYDDIRDFFEEWPHGQDRDSWNPKPYQGPPYYGSPGYSGPPLIHGY